MELLIKFDDAKKEIREINAIGLANEFYKLCKVSMVDVTTVANIMLLEANQERLNSMCCEARSDTI